MSINNSNRLVFSFEDKSYDEIKDLSSKNSNVVFFNRGKSDATKVEDKYNSVWAGGVEYLSYNVMQQIATTALSDTIDGVKSNKKSINQLTQDLSKKQNIFSVSDGLSFNTIDSSLHVNLGNGLKFNGNNIVANIGKGLEIDGNKIIVSKYDDLVTKDMLQVYDTKENVNSLAFVKTILGNDDITAEQFSTDNNKIGYKISLSSAFKSSLNKYVYTFGNGLTVDNNNVNIEVGGQSGLKIDNDRHLAINYGTGLQVINGQLVCTYQAYNDDAIKNKLEELNKLLDAINNSKVNTTSLLSLLQNTLTIENVAGSSQDTIKTSFNDNKSNVAFIPSVINDTLYVPKDKTGIDGRNTYNSFYLPSAENSDPEITLATKKDIDDIIKSSNKIVIRKNPQDGEIGSGATCYLAGCLRESPEQYIQYSKDIYFRGNSIFYTSDKRLKHDIMNISQDVKTKIWNTDNLIKSFIYNNDADKRIHYGFIAQEVQKILPNAVLTDEDGQMSVDYTSTFAAIIDMLIDKVKEQDKRIQQLENINQQLGWHTTSNI